jgi:hypothetical protein
MTLFRSWFFAGLVAGMMAGCRNGPQQECATILRSARTSLDSVVALTAKPGLAEAGVIRSCAYWLRDSLPHNQPNNGADKE